MKRKLIISGAILALCFSKNVVGSDDLRETTTTTTTITLPTFVSRAAIRTSAASTSRTMTKKESDEEAFNRLFKSNISEQLKDKSEREICEEAIFSKSMSIQAIQKSEEIKDQLKEKEDLLIRKSTALDELCSAFQELKLPGSPSLIQKNKAKEELSQKRLAITQKYSDEVEKALILLKVENDTEVLEINRVIALLDCDHEILEKDIDAIKKEIKELGKKLIESTLNNSSLDDEIEEYNEMKDIKITTNLDLHELNFNDNQLISRGDFVQSLIDAGVPRTLLKNSDVVDSLLNVAAAKLELPLGLIDDGEPISVLKKLDRKVDLLLNDVKYRKAMSLNSTMNLFAEMHRKQIPFDIGRFLPSDDNELYKSLTQNNAISDEKSLFFINFLTKDLFLNDKMLSEDIKLNLLTPSWKNALKCFVGALYAAPYPIEKLSQRELEGWKGLAYIANNFSPESLSNQQFLRQINQYAALSFFDVYFYWFNVDLLDKIKGHIVDKIKEPNIVKSKKFYM